MVVVDTNVLAYLLIEGDRTEQAQALLARDADWRSDAFILVEFSNVLATYRRLGALNSTQTEALMVEAQARIRTLMQCPHVQALRIAHELSVAAYDARFIAAARSSGTKLVTEDSKLRAAAPSATVSLAEVSAR